MEVLLYLLNMLTVFVVALTSLWDDRRGEHIPLVGLFRPKEDDSAVDSPGSTRAGRINRGHVR